KLTFYATAVDTFGNESAPSHRASYPYDYDSPIITSLSPASGTVETVVTIRGNHFGPSQGSSSVLFNSVSATVTSWSNTAIECTVPSGATTGPVMVETSVSVSKGKTFAVKPPAITALSPTSGTVGTVLTIAGNYFGPSQGSSGVSFNSVSATVTSWSNNAIKCAVPSGATTGPVVVETSVGVSNGKTFAVKLPAITALSPTSGTVGTTVTIRGNYFGPSQGSSSVSFNSVSATVTSWSNTAIKCTVPSGATSGPVVVTTTVGASNGKTFTVKP
ncbi:MAG TPA: IPT/TIG domain-containing protein, partial [Thermodesulfobacteriota bacterium]|nr:IPT/TIG domain-containing protein [Thermodesulfobacteriota bacterium]